MTEEQKEKYANFLDKVSEILGLNKPVDILRLCAVTDEYLRPIEKHIAELEKKNAELEAQIEKMQETLKSDLIARLKEDISYSTSPSCTKGMELFIKSIERWEIKKENENV